ncbi:ADP-ribosylglycohydrolase family protein [Desulfonema ishimotonii]|uniref:ADP-ribosylglycohydrolase family protein n=1 Tax=Desulfonema ishimotonii TaxID=45657 RepID=A0A401G3X8_9BACT|nr:ADP-ribosylglycohydrolase family protein [Desulfonema ishimotonii]GBC63891.1 ADP-ribosylglycohydrolase family protein [Desulfonema ishimotonii]
MRQINRQDRFRGVILGTAIGDAVGLPAEGISRRRSERLFKGRWHHRLIFGRGMVSDDTEHTVFVAQSLLAHPASPEQFAGRLSRCLRWWLLSLPAGVGWATLRALIRLCVGISPGKSGVWSAGNGPAMRAAPVGAFFAESPDLRDACLRAATRITHTDPRALTGAKAVADMVARSIREGGTQRPAWPEFLSLLRSAGEGDGEWLALTERLTAAWEKGLDVREFAAELGLDRGVTGYVYHTVPVALYAWYRHFGNFSETLCAVWDCGGDTDTTGAIAGALAGAVTGESGMPHDWVSGIRDWPRSLTVLRKIADALAAKGGQPDIRPVSYPVVGVLPRNLLFLVIVLLHGMRRLLPPY